MTQKPRMLVHTSHQAIRWGDMDKLGHVNSTVYFRFFEQARIEWLHACYPDGGVYLDQGPVIVNASCTFKKPLVYPGDVEVMMYLRELGRTSVVSWYELWMDGVLYADGAAKIVWIDLASGRAIPLPEAVAAPVRAHAAAAAAK